MSPASLPSSTPRPAQWLAPHVGRSVSELSRVARLGEGSVIGGKVALSLDRAPPRAPGRAHDRGPGVGDQRQDHHHHVTGPGPGRLRSDGHQPQGANLASGLAGALLASPDATYAALEVDEAVLPWALGELHPRAVALLNLSRDQLDRLHEVRATAERWRRALADRRAPAGGGQRR